MSVRIVAGILGAIVLALTPAGLAEETILLECEVDVGTPLAMADADGEGPEGPAIGGCIFLEEAEDPLRVSWLFQADWSLTLNVQDCVHQMDVDGDGTDYERVQRGTEIPPGAKLWANCSSGYDLTNKIWLEPV